MDFTALQTFVTSVGFPIVMCLLMFYYMQKLNENHDAEIKALTETINTNTQVLTELATLIKNMKE